MELIYAPVIEVSGWPTRVAQVCILLGRQGLIVIACSSSSGEEEESDSKRKMRRFLCLIP